MEHENSKLLTKLTCEMIISEERGYQPGQEIKKIKSKLVTTNLTRNQTYFARIKREVEFKAKTSR